MTLVKRLLLGSVVIVLVLVAGIVVIAGTRLRTRLSEDMQRELVREARLVASSWHAGIDADSLADAAGQALGRRVTLIDSAGRVIGDSEFSGEALAGLQNHYNRPEVVLARRNGAGSSMRTSPSAGDDEIYVAIRTPSGFARVSVATTKLREIEAGAQKDVLIAGMIAVVLALIVSVEKRRPLAA